MRKLLALLLLLPLLAQAGTVTGNIQTASSGAVVNGTLTFTLNQFAVVSGTAQVVATGVQCYTSTAGAITGEPDPQTAPVLSVNLGSGTLAAGTYFVKYTYFDGTGESLPSPEASITLVSPGTVIVAVPAIQPANATGWRVYISAATGTETRQSSQTGFAASYQQTAALAAGTALPGSNTSACSIRFTDEMIPSTTYYTINLVNSLGSKIAGYPISQARFYGGTNGSVNVSSGWPVSIGGVIWPSPIVSTPNSNATQSIAGGLSLGAFPFTAGNGTFTSLNVSKVIRDCRTDNLKCDGTTDDSAAINACLSNAYSAGYGGVQLPSGQCKVNTTINDTNKPNLDFFGSNSNEDWSTATTNQNFGTTLTQLLCNTGATPCFDVTGTGRARLMNFGLRAASGYTSPSQIAFMFGRDNAVSGPAWTTGTGTFCFAQENKLENVWVYFDTRPTATAVGTVAVYNVGAEQFQILGGGYIADNPVFITATNDLSLASPYQTLATGCPASMTEVKVGHGASFQAWTRSAFDLRGIIDFESEKDTEILNGVIGTNHSPAVTINSGANVPTNITLQGQDEGFDFPLTLNTSVEGLDARLTAVAPTAAGLITIGNGITVSDCYINMPQINGTIQPLVNILSGTATMRGCIIFEGKNLGTGAGAANVTLTNSTIYAPGLTDTQVNTFKSGSSYNVQDSTGNSTVGNYSVGGNLGVGAASSASVGVLENNSALTGTSQFGIQAAPSTSSAATAEGAGLVGRADTAAAAFVQALNVGVHVTTPTVGAGSSITEWDGVRIEKAPTAGTKCSIFVAGSTSGSACVNAPATAGVSSTLPSTAGTLTVTVGSGTAAMTTAGIATGACGTTVTVGATGVATTDIINISHNAAVTIGNGGGLTLNAWPTANNVNFNYCNSSAGTITPTAMTINWNVTR